jgi:hypothetical protein
MASSDLATWVKTWQRDGADYERQQNLEILEGLSIVSERKSKFFSGIKQGPKRNDTVVYFYEEVQPGNSITGTLSSTTLTFSGNLQGSAITGDTLKNHVRKLTVLMRESDGMKCYVTASMSYDSAPYEATVAAYGNNTLSDDSSATTYLILGVASSDYDSEYVVEATDHDYRWVSTQTFKHYLEIPYTYRDTSLRMVADKLGHDLNLIINTINNRRMMATMEGEPPYDSGYKHKRQEDNSFVTGIFTWPKIVQSEMANTDVYVNNGGDPLTPDILNRLINNLAESETADYNEGDWVLLMNPITHDYLSDFYADQRDFAFSDTDVGYTASAFRSKIGKRFPIIPDWYCTKSKMALIDRSTLEWGWFGNQALKNETLGTSTINAKQKKIYGQWYGIICRRPRQIGVVYNMPTTFQ